MMRRAVALAVLCCMIGAACNRSADSYRDGESAASAGFILQPGEGEVLRLGGVGGQVVIKVDPAKTGSPAMAMGIQDVEGEIPVHMHQLEEEILFVHSGHGVGTLGNDLVPVESGTTIYIPPGTWHGLRNTGDEPSRILWVVTSGAGRGTQLEKFFREIGTPPGTDAKPLTAEQIGNLMKKHGMRPQPQ